MEFEPQATLTEQIADHLGGEIIAGRLAPASRIQELKVAGELGVSRGSVREALLILESRHLIEIIPRRGAVVSSMESNEIADFCELGAFLDMPVNTYSDGMKLRLGFAISTSVQPDILLLDEPTNHLDAESVAWLERFLQDYAGTVVAITHDRYFLDNVAKWILELDRGRGIPFSGNYSSWLEQKQARLAQEEREDSRRRRTLNRELEWIRMTPKARQTKSKARINAYESLLARDSTDREKESQLQRLAAAVNEMPSAAPSPTPPSRQAARPGRALHELGVRGRVGGERGRGRKDAVLDLEPAVADRGGEGRRDGR